MMTLYNKSIIRFLALAISFIFAFTFAGCSQNSPALGKFVCVSAEYDGISLEPSLLGGGDVFLELGENGWGTFRVGDKNSIVNWSLDGEELKLVLDNKSYSGSYVDEMIEIELLDSGLMLSFAVEGSETATENSLAVQAYYGWWDIGDAGGAWQEYTGMRFDCCAVIEFDESGNGEFVMWDEDSSYKNPLARVKLKTGEKNVAADKGAFLNCVVDESNLHFNNETAFEDMLIAELAYSDDSGVFNSVIYLRPWGLSWDDIQENAPELLPYHYDNWYLPLIEAGSQMPGEFEFN